MKPIEVISHAGIDKNGAHLFSVRMLHEFGRTNGYLNKKKLVQLWKGFSEHPVLFTDEIEGDLEAFVDIVMNPNSVWLEIFDALDNKPLGVYYLSRVIPGFDALGHIAYWDRAARGREVLTMKTMKWVMDRYSLHRLTAEIPCYQTGTIRMAQSLGMTKEGVKREAVVRREKRVDLAVFGILYREVREAMENGTYAERKERDASRE